MTRGTTSNKLNNNDNENFILVLCNIQSYLTSLITVSLQSSTWIKHGKRIYIDFAVTINKEGKKKNMMNL